MRNKPNMIIFSVDLKNQTNESYERARRDLIRYLNHIGYPNPKVLLGCYKGITEASYIAPASLSNDLLPYLTAQGQESVLYLHGDDHAELVYLNGPERGARVSLGTLKPVSMVEAKRLDAWTLDATTNQYYAVL
jgi:hypothetical protein